MVTSVNTNVNALAAIQSLTEISNQMTSTQSAIESGLMVNQSSDNPAVFTIAQGMRANSDALTAVGNSLTSGIATVQSAANAATSISNALGTLLQTVTQAASLTDPSSVSAMNTQIKNALSNIDAFASAATLNGINLLSATHTNLNVVHDVAGDYTTVAGVNSTSAGLGLAGLQVNTGGTKLATVAGDTIATGDVVKVTESNGDTIDFEFNDGTAALASQPSATNTVVAVNMSVTDTNSTLLGKLITAMNNNGVDASEDTSGNITVGGGSTASIVAGGSGAIAATAVPGTGASAIAAVNAAITTIGTTLSTLGAAAIQLQGLSDFTSQLGDSVTTSLGSLVDANLSAESAQLSSLQTKQSLAIQSLTLANQGPSSLLSLFR